MNYEISNGEIFDLINFNQGYETIARDMIYGWSVRKTDYSWKKKRTTDDQETRKKGMEINNSLF